MPRKVTDALLLVEQAAPSTPASGLVAFYAKVDGRFYLLDDTGAEVALNSDDLATFSGAGTLTTGTGVSRFRFPFAAKLLGVTAAVGTAPTGAALILDVNKNGTTIFSTQGNRPTIAISGFATTSEPAPDVTTIAAGDYLTVDRDQVGSTIAGADLTVFVRYRRT